MGEALKRGGIDLIQHLITVIGKGVAIANLCSLKSVNLLTISYFFNNFGLLVSGADMFKDIEEVATADELNLLRHVIKRARESLRKNGV